MYHINVEEDTYIRNNIPFHGQTLVDMCWTERDEGQNAEGRKCLMDFDKNKYDEMCNKMKKENE